ncbi:hypothetical protein ACOMHN_033607 [Nucella lapillus]
MSYTPFHRKTMKWWKKMFFQKWWKKMFFHLFTLSIIQSSMRRGRGGKKLLLKQFVVRLGLATNDHYQAGVAAAAAGQAAANLRPTLLSLLWHHPLQFLLLHHPLQFLLLWARLGCRAKHHVGAKVRKTANVCAKCGVPLCDKIIQPQGNGDLTCFRLYHTVKNYYTDY